MAGLAIPGMMALTAAGGLTSAAGTIMGGNAAKRAGDYAVVAAQAAKAAQDFKAGQLRQNAVQERAVAQRTALETGLKTTYAQSTLQAGAAASGGSATDEGVLNLTGQIAGRGKYMALADMYQGENRARGLEAEAEGAEYTGDLDVMEGQQRQLEGREKQEASRFAAAGTILGSAGSMFKNYGEMTNPYYGGRSYG